MLNVQAFIFNLYQENTYILSDSRGEAVIVDPGCYTSQEQEALVDFVEKNHLNVKFLLNTHGHIDHMLGNAFVKSHFQVPFITHQKVIGELEAVSAYGALMGLSAEPSPMPDQLVDEGDKVTFGDISLEVFFTPGHSPGHISFYHRESKQLISGDVLFDGSIGRTDLPGGSYEVLMESITKKLMPLPDAVRVYSGHGPSTTIGKERASNPFILSYLNA